MKTLNLTIGERFTVRRIVDENGTGLALSGLRLALKLADNVAITEKELKKVKYTFNELTKTQKWNEKGSEKEIEFSNDEIKLLEGFLEKRDKEKKYSVDGGALVVSLADKLGIKEEDEK